jgi:hypothetical protein
MFPWKIDEAGILLPPVVRKGQHFSYASAAARVPGEEDAAFLCFPSIIDQLKKCGCSASVRNDLFQQRTASEADHRIAIIFLMAIDVVLCDTFHGAK